MTTVVLKFGGAAVAEAGRFAAIADIIISHFNADRRVVVVVSAMGDATDKLIELAREVHPHPPQREYDMLVSAGERVSIALLAMSLARKGVAAISFTGSQAGIITDTNHMNARIIRMQPKRILQQLDSGKVVIVAGFQGVSAEGEITTLGRGGSDTSAVALAVALQGRVVFYKDVLGLYDTDPRKKNDALFFKSLSYDEALSIVKCGDHFALHPRCIELAQKNTISLQLRSFFNLAHAGTTIGEQRHMATTLVPFYED